MTRITVEDLGLIEYDSARQLQETYAAEIAEGKRLPTLLLLEHPHVYTFGAKGSAKNLLWNEEQLKQKGVVVRWTDRGGDVTYHGPGQLVGYPLLALGKLNQANEFPQTDYVRYVRKLEQALIIALSRFGLAAGQIKGKTGVWIQSDAYSRCPSCKPEDKQSPAKLAAIGVKVDARGITRHGFALNVNPDMEYWRGIVPCGLTEPVVSLADLLDPVPGMERVKAETTRAFLETFEA